MSEMLGVDTAVVSTAADDVAAAVAAMRARIGDMESSLIPLRHLWTGSASDAFTTSRAAWRGHLADMVATLERIGAATDASATRYAGTESDVTSLWR